MNRDIWKAPPKETFDLTNGPRNVSELVKDLKAISEQLEWKISTGEYATNDDMAAIKQAIKSLEIAQQERDLQ